MGLVHVRAWQKAYRGLMPDDYLGGLDASDRAALWRDALAQPRPGQESRVLVVDGELAGFAICGPEAGASGRRDIGELHALNLDPRHWGRGLGRALLREVTTVLAGAAYDSAVLWVVPENGRARRLYESEGWIHEGAVRDAVVLGVTVNEVRYERHLS